MNKGFTRMHKMRIVMFLIVSATAAAKSSHIAPIPTILEEATPAEVLLYLYDVVLTSHMSKEVNHSGGTIFTSLECPGGVKKYKSGGCPPVSTLDPNDYDLLFDSVLQKTVS